MEDDNTNIISGGGSQTGTNNMSTVSSNNNTEASTVNNISGTESVKIDASKATGVETNLSYTGGLKGYNIDIQYKNKVKDPFNGLNDLKTPEDGNLVFYLPQYGVEEYINDRTIWQKQLYTIGGEQGWFYFKVFFNFKTQYGLLGGLLHENNQPILAKHSAVAFLAAIENRYKQEQIPHRMLALYKFGSTLKSIQTETPWLIKGVNGLDQINGANINDFGKLKSIELVMNSETTDMRIGTMLDLYKYACYDSLNCKEIIPANLRKFEMSVLCFHVPIKYHQTKIYSDSTSTIVTTETTKTKKDGTVKTTTSKSRGDVIDAKTTFLKNRQASDFSNMMSFKLFSFKNCEFATDTLDGTISGSLSNENAFNLGGQNIKINYERVYEHRMNEFGEFFMGDTGFMYNENAPSAFIGKGKLYENSEKPYKIHEQEGQNLQHKRYGFIADKHTLYEFTDGVIRDANIDATSWGDLNSFSVGRMGKDNLGTRHNSPYLNEKLKALKSGTLGKNVPTTALRSFTTGGFNLLSDWINGVTKKNNPEGAQQNRTGVGNARKNTDYFNKKIDELKNGKVQFSPEIEKTISAQEKGWTWAPNVHKTIDEKIDEMRDGKFIFSTNDTNDFNDKMKYWGEKGWITATPKTIDEKIADMKDGEFQFSTEDTEKFNDKMDYWNQQGWITATPKTIDEKIADMKDCKVIFSTNDTEKFNEKMEYWNEMGLITQTPKTIDQKIEEMKDGKVNFSSENESKIANQESGWTWAPNNPKTIDEKIADMKDGKVNFSSENESKIANQESGWNLAPNNPKTIDEKIADMKDGKVNFSPKNEEKIANQENGWNLAPNNPKTIDEKIADMKDGKVNFSPENESKITVQEQGWTIAPNMYKKNRDVGLSGRENTDYFNKKLAKLDDGVVDISNESEDRPDSYKQNRTGWGDERTNTPYFKKKLAKLDNGVKQIPNDATKGLSGGNLHDIHEKLTALRNGTLK